MKTYNNAKELCADDYDNNFWRFGRSLYKYTDCGPWSRLVLTEDRNVYYESKGADDPTLLDDPDIIGIEIGSIVEGSDVEIGPEFLKFPFTEKELWDTVEQINEEASFYWKRDNEDDFLIEVDGNEYYITVGWGIEFPEGLPENVKTFFEENYDEISNMDDLSGTTWVEDGYTITKLDKSDFIF